MPSVKDSPDLSALQDFCNFAHASLIFQTAFHVLVPGEDGLPALVCLQDEPLLASFAGPALPSKQEAPFTGTSEVSVAVFCRIGGVIATLAGWAVNAAEADLRVFAHDAMMPQHIWQKR